MKEKGTNNNNDKNLNKVDMVKIEDYSKIDFKSGVELQKEYIDYMIKHLTEGNKKYHDEILVQLLGIIDEELGNEYSKTLKNIKNESIK